MTEMHLLVEQPAWLNKEISKKLEHQRTKYDQKWGELILAEAFHRIAQEQVEIGTPFPVALVYSNEYCGVAYHDYLDSDFYQRHHLKPINALTEMFNLLEKEIQSEFEFRKQVIREYISRNDLEKYTLEIIEGMNKTCSRVAIPLEDITLPHPIVFRGINRANSIILLNFGLDYVNRWKMYHELFQNSEIMEE